MSDACRSTFLAPSCVMLIIAATACGGARNEGDSFTRRDSGDIEIVQSARPRWSAGDAWRVDTAPSLSIGTALDGNAALQFTRVGGVARSSDGGIAVVDDQTAELRIFDASGRPVATAGGKGGGPGEYEPPLRLLRLPGDTLLVAGGFMAPRMGLHAPDGRFVRMLELPRVGEEKRPATLTYRFADGSSLVTRGGFSVVQPRTGTWTDSVAYHRVVPGTDSAVPFGTFPALTFSGNGPTIARVGWSARLEMAQYGNRLFVGFPTSYQIAEHASDGRLVRLIRRAWTPVPVDQAARDAHAARMYGDAAPPLRDRYLAVLTFAEHHPAYDAMIADAEGNVWARAPRLDPEGLSGDAPPVPVQWSVFDTSGAWLGDVTMPAGLHPHEIGSDFVLGVWHDADGVSYVRMHRLVKER